MDSVVGHVCGETGLRGCSLILDKRSFFFSLLKMRIELPVHNRRRTCDITVRHFLLHVNLYVQNFLFCIYYSLVSFPAEQSRWPSEVCHFRLSSSP